MMAGPRQNGPSRLQEARRRIAIEAARLISENGLRDYQQAKLKAASRLGVFEEAGLPSNREIEDALREHQRLFQGNDHLATLLRLREAACEAMRFFARHEPRLVGAVLDGTADAHSAICLHLYTDQPDTIIAELHDHGIPFDEQSRQLRLDRDSVREFPALTLSADGTPVDLTLLPYDLLRQAPLDRISGKPMQRASLSALQALLAQAP